MAWIALVTATILLLFVTQSSLAADDNRTCYDSSGKVALLHIPCVDASAQTSSHCCSLWDTCIGDTLCLSQIGTLWVGSCTIQDWGTVGRYIGVCDSTSDGWEFCCGLENGGHEACCAEKYAKRFKITGNVTSKYSDQRPWLDEGSAGASSSASPSTSATSSANSATCPSVPSTSSKMGAQIGLGVGLGAPLLIVLGLLLWEHGKRRQAEASLGQYTIPAPHVQPLRPGNTNTIPGYEPVSGDEVGGEAELALPTLVHELSSGRRGYASVVMGFEDKISVVCRSSYEQISYDALQKRVDILNGLRNYLRCCRRLIPILLTRCE
jgi:hypothetical protein